MSFNTKSCGIRFLVFISIGFLCMDCTSKSNGLLGPIHYPSDNPYQEKIAELGEILFFDRRLSFDNSISCSTCHLPEKAFTDGRSKSRGVHGKTALRNAPSLFNVAYQKKLMADGEVPTLEMQVLVPLQDTSEMANNMGELIRKLKAIPFYQKKARELFGRDFDAFVLTRSLAQYERTLLSNNSSFDQWYYEGNPQAISTSAKKGWKIFSEKLYCTHCHPAPFFTNFKVENNGLYQSYDNIMDKGRFRINGDSSEIGSFKVPSLRNVSKTGPYMHDGSLKSIDSILDFYSRGGNHSKQQNTVIQPFILTKVQRENLKAFLQSLED